MHKSPRNPFAPVALVTLLTVLVGLPGPLQAETPASLGARAQTPVELTMAQPTSLQDLYRKLGEQAGVHVLFEPRMKDMEIDLNLGSTSLGEALGLVASASGTFYKVLNGETILVAADTPQNRRNYSDLGIRTYFLENADVPEVVTALRSLLQSKHIAADQERRVLTLRDTASRIALADRLVDILDHAPAEARVAVDVLAVDPSILSSLEGRGPRLPSEEIEALRHRGGVTVLAAPNVNVLKDGRAELRLTDAVPVVIPPADRAGENPEVVRYVDVGLELYLRAAIHPTAREISLRTKLQLETLLPTSGSSLPTHRQRWVEDSLRLQEGESYLITGLLEANPRAAGLFGGASVKEGQQVVIVLTPHITRQPGLAPADLEALWIGTESWIDYQAEQLPTWNGQTDGIQFRGTEGEEAVRQRVRERLAKLPRGLQSEDEGGEGEPD